MKRSPRKKKASGRSGGTAPQEARLPKSAGGRAKKRSTNGEGRHRSPAGQVPAIAYTAARDEARAMQFISPGVERLLGFSPSDFEADPLLWRNHLHPDDRERVLSEMARTRLSGEPFVSEYRMLGRDGRTVWFRDQGVVVRDATGGPPSLQGVMCDITEGKRAEETLAQRGRWLAALNDLAIELASLPSGAVPRALAKYLMATTGAVAVSLAKYDASDRVIVPCHLEIEPEMLEQVQRLLGQPLLDVRSPVSEEMYRRIVSTVVGTVSTLTETTFGAIPPAAGDAIQKMVGADRFTGIAYVVEGELYGTSVLVMRPGTPDPSPDLLASFAHMAAVSLRRCAVEEALVESEEKFRVLAEQSPNMIFINRKSRVVYANRRCEEIMGHTRDEFRSPDFDFFSLHPPEWKDAVRSLFRRHMKGEEVEPLEYSLVTRDGGRIEAILTVRLISYEGEPAVFGTITDVTELRRLQRQVLETAERERRRTGSDMHDVLGQNLTGAAMLSEALEKSLAGAAPSEAPKAAQLTKLLYEATGQVRQFAKGLCPVDTTPEGLMKALTELASNTSQLFRISCRFRAAGRVLVHDGDAAEHLYRIAQEAITNSVKHGGAKNVTVALRSADGNLTLSVQDDGKGFPEDSAEGAGLGLRIMRHRTNMMHGILDTRNAPDGGAVVSCTVAGAAGKSLKRPRGTGRAAGRERRR